MGFASLALAQTSPPTPATPSPGVAIVPSPSTAVPQPNAPPSAPAVPTPPPAAAAPAPETVPAPSAPSPGPPSNPPAAETEPASPPQVPSQPQPAQPQPADPQPAVAPEPAALPDEPAAAITSEVTSREIIETRILPSIIGFSDAALTLQNAVLRRCMVGDETSRRAMHEAFTATVKAAGGVVPLAFGAAESRNAPSLLLTHVADTAFSRSQIDAIVKGRLQAEQSLASLRLEHPALVGLSALEYLLIDADDAVSDTISYRCRHARMIVASLRLTGLGMERAWRTGRLTAHWGVAPPELADRLRLRDVIQGMIATVDRLDRLVVAFTRQAEDNRELPFADRDHMILLLDGLAAALARQAGTIAIMTDASAPQQALLDTIADAVEEGRVALEGEATTTARSAILLPFEAVRVAVVERVPELFGFDPAAFQYPLASFETAPAPKP